MDQNIKTQVKEVLNHTDHRQYALPEKQWAEAGMAISFLGREICRPSHPEHAKCIMRNHCNYFQEQQRAATGKSSKTKKKQNQGN